jgi:molybdate transport system regulatory protein
MQNSAADEKEGISPPLQIGHKFWFEIKETPVLGPGDVQLLITLRDTKNLTKAAAQCHYSYKYAWKKIKQIENRTHMPIVVAKKGGYGGGGGVEITPWTEKIIDAYHIIQEKLQTVVKQLDRELNQILSKEK